MARGQGLSKFVSLSTNRLTHGGAVTLAINATRTPKLDLNNPQKSVGYFIAALQAKNVTDYGVLLVSFAVKGAKSYGKEEVGGMNFRRKYIISIGKYYVLDELLKQKGVDGKVGNV